MNEGFSKEDRELLIRLDERVCSLTKHFANHIRHHWMLTIPLALALLGVVIKWFIG